MPPESLLLAVTSGLGVGIFAGIVSGVCYIVVTGFASSKRQNRDSGVLWQCCACGRRSRSPLESLISSGRVVACSKCGGKACRTPPCSQFLGDTPAWLCRRCAQREEPPSWSKGILQAIQNFREGKKSEMEDETERDPDGEKRDVRDFMERLVEAMLGKNIDSANVTRMYSDEKYLPVLGQSPCSAHASLKLIIQRVIQEAIGLPPMDKNATDAIEMSNGEVENRTYEDLLATAILNKVVENYQEELSGSGSRPNSRRSNPLTHRNDKEYFFGGETLCAKWASTPNKGDAGSVSSLEDWIRSDSSVSSTKLLDHSALRIHQPINELSTSDEETPTKPSLDQTFVVPDENEWRQENWSLQKRAFGRNASPAPVPMLVPNSISEAKVLIGDRDADDTTDLSDAGSDFDEVESSHGIEQILTLSKTIIGGKNPLFDDGFVLGGKEAGVEEVPFGSLESQTEQDTEYTEKYATLPRTILKSPVRKSNESLNETAGLSNGIDPDETLDETTELPNGVEHDEDQVEVKSIQNGYCVETHDLSPDEVDLITESFKGTYSQREKQKWNNAVEMKNNPYSSENLKQRLSLTKQPSAVSSMFTTQTSLNVRAPSPPPSKEKPADTFTALPAIVYNEKSLEMSSDSDLSVERVYNLASGKVFVGRKPEGDGRESLEDCMEFSYESCCTDASSLNREDSADPEIIDLCDKHLVRDLLGQYSKSYPNLACSGRESNGRRNSVENGFNGLKNVYSLTARSIPKEFRRELKESDLGSSSSSAILYEVISQEATPFPIARNRIQFFESLK